MHRYWQDRFGLRARMTASYVVVTAAAVILVEAIAIAFTIPSLLANQDLINRVRYTASAYGDAAAAASSTSTQLVLPSDYLVGQPGSTLGPGKIRNQGYGLEIPQIATALPGNAAPVSMALVFSSDGQVLASSYPARYPAGSYASAVLPDGLTDTSSPEPADEDGRGQDGHPEGHPSGFKKAEHGLVILNGHTVGRSW